VKHRDGSGEREDKSQVARCRAQQQEGRWEREDGSKNILYLRYPFYVIRFHDLPTMVYLTHKL
jgi:hypothetical protein